MCINTIPIFCFVLETSISVGVLLIHHDSGVEMHVRVGIM
jgi:hypothetical protein